MAPCPSLKNNSLSPKPNDSGPEQIERRWHTEEDAVKGIDIRIVARVLSAILSFFKIIRFGDLTFLFRTHVPKKKKLKNNAKINIYLL